MKDETTKQTQQHISKLIKPSGKGAKKLKKTGCQENVKKSNKFSNDTTPLTSKKIQKMTCRHIKRLETILRNSSNKIILGTEDKLTKWKEYIQSFFDDERPDVPPHTDNQTNEKSSEISK